VSHNHDWAFGEPGETERSRWTVAFYVPRGYATHLLLLGKCAVPEFRSEALSLPQSTDLDDVLDGEEPARPSGWDTGG
jgi:hypothetical protein